MARHANGSEYVGPYRLVQQLGVSGLGMIWQAVHSRTEQDVTLKVLLADHRGDRRCRDRFRDECEFALSVRHPGLCRAIENGETPEGTPYLVLEPLEGVPLARKTVPGQPWAAEQAVNLVLGLADAVGTLHKLGRLHGGLNPDCILVHADGRPSLLDHGLSRPLKDSGTLVNLAPVAGGPQAYLAPEQIQGPTEDLCPATDVYALGVLLYQLLTGRLPYQGRGVKVFDEILAGNAAAPVTMRADIEPALNVVCMRAMARQIAHRFPSTDKLAVALRQALRPSGRPPSDGLIDTDLPTFAHSIEFDSGPDVRPGEEPEQTKTAPPGAPAGPRPTAVTIMEGQHADQPPPDVAATMGPGKRGLPTLSPRGGPPTQRAPVPLPGSSLASATGGPAPVLPAPDTILPPSLEGRGTEATLSVQQPAISLPDVDEPGPELPKTMPPKEVQKRVALGRQAEAPLGVVPPGVDLDADTKSVNPPAPPAVGETTAAPTVNLPRPVVPRAPTSEVSGPHSQATLVEPEQLSSPLWVEPEGPGAQPTAATAPLPGGAPPVAWAEPVIPPSVPAAPGEVLASMLPQGAAAEFPFNVPTAPVPYPVDALPAEIEPFMPIPPGSGSMPGLPVVLPPSGPFVPPPPPPQRTPRWLILLAIGLLCLTLFAVVMLGWMILQGVFGGPKTGTGTPPTTSTPETTRPTETTEVRPTVRLVVPGDPVRLVAGYPAEARLKIERGPYNQAVAVRVTGPTGLYRDAPRLELAPGINEGVLSLPAVASYPADTRELTLEVTGDRLTPVTERLKVECVTATAELKPTLSAIPHGGPVEGVAFSRNGRYLALGGVDRTVHIWDLQEARLVQTLRSRVQGAVLALAFSKVDDLGVICRGAPTLVWRRKGGDWRHEYTIDPENGFQTTALTFGPASDRLALALPYKSASDTGDRRDFRWVIDFWDMTERKLRGGLDLPGKARVTALAWGPPLTPPFKGRGWIASATDDPSGDIRLQQVEDIKGEGARALVGHTGAVPCLAVSDDGRQLASGGSDGTVRLWDLITLKGREVGRHSGPVVFVRFDATGKLLASGAADGSAAVRTLAGGGRPQEWPALKSEVPTGWGFSPDGKTLCRTTSGGTVELLDAAGGGLNLRQPPSRVGTVERVAYSPDGTRLATAGSDHVIRVWGGGDLRQPLRTLRGHTDAVGPLAFSPDGRYLASGGSDHTARLWDMTTGQEVPLSIGKLSSFCYAVAFSPDGKHLAVGTGDWNGVEYTAGEVRVWDVGTNQQVWRKTGHTRTVLSLAYTPDGRHLLSGGADGLVKVWRADSGDDTGQVLNRNRGSVRALTLSPDGRWLAAGGVDVTSEQKRGEVYLWSVRGAAPGSPASEGLAFEPTAKNLDYQGGMVRGLAFSPSSRTLIAVGNGPAIKLWDVGTQTGHAEPPESHEDDVYSVAISKDGRVATGSGGSRQGGAGADGPPTLRLWDLKEDVRR